MALLLTEEKQGVLNLTLNRVNAHNALNAELITSLTESFAKIHNQASIRAVVLKAAGKSFCAGGDLNWMQATLDHSLEESEKDSRLLADMYEAIFTCPAPVLALCHGSVLGGGVGLVAACDVVAAEANTRFCFSEVKLGLVPAVISPYVLNKLKPSEAKPLMLTAKPFDATHAKEINLVDFTGSLDATEAYVDELIALIQQNGTQATRRTKELLLQLPKLSWSEAREATITLNAKQRRSDEGQEGMRAFLEKRTPTWRAGS